MATAKAICPGNYPKFQCIGSACEDSCCIGWQVDLDQETFHFYKQNQHKALVKIFRESVRRNPSSKEKRNFGTIVMKPDGCCAFLDSEKLCKIQKNLGPEALSAVCATYPRRVNRFAHQIEYSLALSCPEAARVLLLDRAPMAFIATGLEPRLPTGETSSEPPGMARHQRATRAELRALLIRILQLRSLDIDTRLMALGLVLDSVGKTAGEDLVHADQRRPGILDHFAGLLENPAAMRQQLDGIDANQELQLIIFGSIVGELAANVVGRNLTQCLIEATQGLTFADQDPQSDDEVIACHSAAHVARYAPFFAENDHILENYLVHQVFHNAFPVRKNELLTYYREMVCNYLFVRMMLLGQAVFHGELTQAIVLRTLQSFSRLAAHHENHVEKISQVLAENDLTDFRSLFQLISTTTAAPSSGQ